MGKCCCLVLVTIVAVLVLGLAIGIPVGMKKAKEKVKNWDPTAVNSACQSTRYPDTCNETFTGDYPRDTNGVMRHSVQSSEKGVNDTLGFMSEFDSSDPVISGAVEVCNEVLVSAREELEAASTALETKDTLGVDTLKDIQAWVSAAMELHTTCIDAFMEVNNVTGSALAKKSAKTDELLSNSLAFINALAQYGNDLLAWRPTGISLPEGFNFTLPNVTLPNIPGFGNRKLLSVEELDALAMAEAAAATALGVSAIGASLKFNSVSTSSSAQFTTSQASVGWLTLPLKSSLIASNLRDFETVVKTPASILISPARAVSTRMSELEEGGAMWEDDGIPESERKLHVSTQLQQLDNPFDPYGALSTPLYQTATFKQPSATEGGPYDYTRSGNPTRDALERTLAKLEGADRAFCFSTGMAALATVMRLAEAGQEIVAGDDIYGGSDRLLSQVAPKSGLIVKRIDTGNLDEVRAAVGPKTKIVWLESPTNPRQMISDIREIAKIAHEYSALVIVDNSIMSPVLSRPLDLGADIVMHSATKFIAGHSDVMAGVLAVKGESLAKEIYFLQNAEGTGLSPFDCWLCLRGIKTMALRVEKQQANAQRIAEFLVDHPLVTRVNYAGLPKHTGRDLHYSQCKGAGSVFSFNTGSLAISKHVVEQTKLFSITVSFGSVKSLISLPCFMSHASIPAGVREARGLTEDLIRISIGIEDVDDLVADLEQALTTAPK